MEKFLRTVGLASFLAACAAAAVYMCLVSVAGMNHP